MQGNSAKGQAFRRRTPVVRSVVDVRRAILALGEDAKRVLAGLPQAKTLPTTS